MVFFLHVNTQFQIKNIRIQCLNPEDGTFSPPISLESISRCSKKTRDEIIESLPAYFQGLPDSHLLIVKEKDTLPKWIKAVTPPLSDVEETKGEHVMITCGSTQSTNNAYVLVSSNRVEPLSPDHPPKEGTTIRWNQKTTSALVDTIESHPDGYAIYAKSDFRDHILHVTNDGTTKCIKGTDRPVTVHVVHDNLEGNHSVLGFQTQEGNSGGLVFWLVDGALLPIGVHLGRILSGSYTVPFGANLGDYLSAYIDPEGKKGKKSESQPGSKASQSMLSFNHYKNTHQYIAPKS